MLPNQWLGSMKTSKIKSISAVLVIMAIFGCKEPNQEAKTDSSKKWFKGNLHTHSYWSDGDEFPEVILDWYKERDYNFVALSDHNTLAEGEKWKVIKNEPLYQNAFKSYLKNYGEDWVEHKTDAGQTKVKLKTYEEYRDLTEKQGRFLVIQSEEITDKYEDKPLHMNATNIGELIEPQGGGSVANVLQNNIDQVLKQRETTGKPIMPHINHPNFFYGVSLEDMKVLNGERFFEVYNGHPMVHNLGDSAHISTEEMWDLINISYLKNNKPIMFGLATDDSHHYHESGNRWSNAGRGWVMVEADSLSADSLIQAMEKGDFYASTGVELDQITFKDGQLSIAISEEPGITYKIAFLGSTKENPAPVEFTVTDGAKASFDMTDDILFVRCRVTSSKLQDNPIENILHEMAWTQPIVNKR